MKDMKDGCGKIICCGVEENCPTMAVQERDGLSTAAEGATRLRIKRQELLYKEEALSSLITSRRGKLHGFLGIAEGAGVPSWSLSLRGSHGCLLAADEILTRSKSFSLTDLLQALSKHPLKQLRFSCSMLVSMEPLSRPVMIITGPGRWSMQDLEMSLSRLPYQR